MFLRVDSEHLPHTLSHIPSMPWHRALDLRCSPHRGEVGAEEAEALAGAVFPEGASEEAAAEAGNWECLTNKTLLLKFLKLPMHLGLSWVIEAAASFRLPPLTCHLGQDLSG